MEPLIAQGGYYYGEPDEESQPGMGDDTNALYEAYLRSNLQEEHPVNYDGYFVHPPSQSRQYQPRMNNEAAFDRSYWESYEQQKQLNESYNQPYNSGAATPSSDTISHP